MTNLRKNQEVTEYNIESSIRPSFRSFDELKELSKNYPPLKKLFGNYILEQSLILLPAERGSAKTWFGMQGCLSISSEQKEFLGEPIELHGNTIFANFELNERTMTHRVNLLYKNPPFPLKQDRYKAYMFTTRQNLQTIYLDLIQLIKDVKPVLLVLDNFRLAFSNTDANNSKEVTKIMNELLTLKDTLKMSILLTDHTRKNSRFTLTDSDLQSGSGTKTDLSDSDMLLRRSSQDKDLRILKRIKSRNAVEDQTAKLLRLNPETLWFECVEDNINEEEHINKNTISNTYEKKDLARTLSDKGYTCQKIADIIGVAKSTISRWINE